MRCTLACAAQIGRRHFDHDAAESAAKPPIKAQSRTMDDKDQHILRLLRADARLPLKTLAAEVGLARSSVRERIAKLEQAGVILGYRAELATSLAAGVRAILLLRLQRTPLPGTIRQILALPGTQRCYSVSGEIDLVVELAVESMQQLNAHRDTIARLDGVADVTTMPVLRVEGE